MTRVRLLLLDDHMLFRESLSRLLESEPDFDIAARCATAGQALEILAQTDIDIVLLDFDLGPETGSQFITSAQERGLRLKILMVTAGVSEHQALQLVAQGVAGIFLKQNSPALLTQAIRKVAAGELWLEGDSTRFLAQAAYRTATRQRAPEFTEREREVLRGVFEGLTNKEVGARLSISESSVKAALQQLFQKTGVRTRSQLVRIAIEQYAGQWR